MRIPFACQTLSWSFLDRVQARTLTSAWLPSLPLFLPLPLPLPLPLSLTLT